MCDVIVARIEKSVTGVSSHDEIFAEVAGCLRAAWEQTMILQHANPESENERAVAVLPIVQCRISRGMQIPFQIT